MKNITENIGKMKRKIRERAPNPAPLNHLVTFYDPHGSYGGPLEAPYRLGEGEKRKDKRKLKIRMAMKVMALS